MDKSIKNNYNVYKIKNYINNKNSIKIEKDYVLSTIKKIENALNNSHLKDSKDSKVSYIKDTLYNMKELLINSLLGEEYMIDISIYVAWNYEEIIDTLYKINILLPDNNKIDNLTFICISLLKDNGDSYLEYPIQISLYEIILVLMILSLSAFGIIAIFVDMLSK